jgi:cytoskeletal protein CcmA (bactofilin family)
LQIIQKIAVGTEVAFSQVDQLAQTDRSLKRTIIMLNGWKNETAKSDPTAVPAPDAIDGSTTTSQKDAGAGISISVPPHVKEPPKAIGNSTIDACLTMRGDLESDADILVKGKVFGNVKCNLLIVDGGANIEGGIDAKEVVIRGTVKGIIKAEKVRLDKTAEVQSDIYQNTFVAEEGARILGTLKSLKDAPKENAAPPSKSCAK